LEKRSFLLKNGILGGAFYENFEWGMLYFKHPLNSRAAKKSLESRTLAMPAVYYLTFVSFYVVYKLFEMIFIIVSLFTLSQSICIAFLSSQLVVL